MDFQQNTTAELHCEYPEKDQKNLISIFMMINILGVQLSSRHFIKDAVNLSNVFQNDCIELEWFKRRKIGCHMI